MKRIKYILLLFCFLSGTIPLLSYSLTPFLAKDPIASIIVCPGGSYSWLAMRTEGTDVARWLQENHINAFVLKYRVASVPAYIFWFRGLGIGHKYPDMLLDVERALKEVYEDYGVDTSTIGVMGFSAGGHLTMASYVYNHTPYKPKFLCPIYPVVTMHEPYVHKRSRRGLLGVWRQFDKTMQDSLSIEDHINIDCPPVFLVNCKDDLTVQYQNSILLDSTLSIYNIPHCYLFYPIGGHGFGVSDNVPCQQWKQEFLLWLTNLIKKSF